MRILKKTGLIIIIALILLLGSFILNLSKREASKNPFPNSYLYTDVEGQELIEKSQILIIGDSGAKKLTRFENNLKELLEEKVDGPIRFYNWAQEGENLSRTIAKLKALKKLPPIIIYQGGADEFVEARFKLDDHINLQKNFKTYRSPGKKSLIELFPTLSKYFFLPTSKLRFENIIIPSKMHYNTDREFQLQSQLTYLFYEEEVKELIRFTSAKKSKLILLTAPINLDLPPLKTCSQAQNKSILTNLQEAEKSYNKGRYKDAYQSIKPILNKVEGHAHAHFLIGQIFRELGQINTSIEHLQKANSFSCRPGRVNKVFNSIIHHYGSKYGVTIIDFETIINRDYGKNNLFFQEDTPQDIYYQKMLGILLAKLKKIMGLSRK